MRDYELTVEELNSQIAEKNAWITNLESEVEREQGRCRSLQEQLSHLTTQEATERERAEKMKVSTALPSSSSVINPLQDKCLSHHFPLLCADSSKGLVLFLHLGLSLPWHLKFLGCHSYFGFPSIVPKSMSYFLSTYFQSLIVYWSMMLSSFLFISQAFSSLLSTIPNFFLNLLWDAKLFVLRLAKYNTPWPYYYSFWKALEGEVDAAREECMLTKVIETANYTCTFICPNWLTLIML